MAKELKTYRIRKVMNRADDEAHNRGDEIGAEQEKLINQAFEDLVKIEQYLEKQGTKIR